MPRIVSEKENTSPKVDLPDAEVKTQESAHAEVVATKRPSLEDKPARRTRRGAEPEHDVKDLEEFLKKQRAEKKLAAEAAKVFTFTEDKLNDPNLPEGALVRTRAYQILVEGPKSLADDAKVDLACDVSHKFYTDAPLYVMSDWIAERVPLATIGPNLVPAVFDDDSEDEDEDSSSEGDFDDESGVSEVDFGDESAESEDDFDDEDGESDFEDEE